MRYFIIFVGVDEKPLRSKCNYKNLLVSEKDLLVSEKSLLKREKDL